MAASNAGALAALHPAAFTPYRIAVVKGMHVSSPPGPADHPPVEIDTTFELSDVVTVLRAAAVPEPAAVVGPLLATELRRIDGARSASITQQRPDGSFVTVAASDAVARRVDEVQYRLGDGPCLRAVTGSVVLADAAVLRSQWSQLAASMHTDTPVRAVLSRPLGRGGLGSLNVYTEQPAGFSAAALTAAADVAAMCALVLVAAQERVRAENLTLALESSRRIGAAIGVVMAGSHCTYEQAFAILRDASQRTHRKIRDVAEDVLYTGTVPGG